MFHFGKPIKVTIDDKLPFVRKFFSYKLSLINARSAQNDSFYLASLFEKAVVQQACFGSYDNCVRIDPKHVFSLLSDCMVSCKVWHKNVSKENILDRLKIEVDNKNFVVLGVLPNITYAPNSDVKCSHAFVVIDYNLEHKAIKLNNPNSSRKTTALSKNLPVSLAERSDLSKGELLITLDQLENRDVAVFFSAIKRHVQISFSG